MPVSFSLLPVIEIRTLLFASAVVFAVLAVAMILVWRGNRRFPGLASLARVHVAMIPGAILIGLPPSVVPSFVSAALGNLLTLLGLLWLLEGIRGLYGLARERWPWILLLAWAAAFLCFLYLLPSLRARILLSSVVPMVFLLCAAWTARHGLRSPEDRAPSLLLLGSFGLLVVIYVARCLSVATDARLVPLPSDVFTIALVTASLIAGTGWTLGVMNLVYARLNEEAHQALTERKRYEAALEQLVQVAAHELRNPLTSIFGTLKLLSAQGDAMSGDERERLLAVARRNSERMVRLINDLLDLERVESGRASFVTEPMDLEPLLLQARELSEGHASQRGVAIEVAPLAGSRVRADPQRLLQVVLNLLSNAVKVSPPGERVSVSAVQADGWVRVAVDDRGPGIPQDLRSRIFQRFARGEASGSDGPDKGSGLGLAISKAIIEGMGGRIGFETRGGAGTTFFFELPADAR